MNHDTIINIEDINNNNHNNNNNNNINIENNLNNNILIINNISNNSINDNNNNSDNNLNINNNNNNFDDINKSNNNNNNKRVIILTGSTDGIGKATLEYLVKNNCNELRFILPVRNIEKGEKVKEEIKQQINNNVDITIMKMDLASLNSIREFVYNFNQLEIPLDILVNNAGLMMTSYTTTVDGFESTFAVNHLGPFLLTNLLIDKLNQSQYGGNIVLVSSVMHEREKLDFDQLLVNEKNYSYVSAYGKSKLCNILFARELQKRLDEQNSNNRIKVNTLHPGSAKTSLSRDYGFFVKKIILPIILFFIGNELNEMASALASLSLNNNNLKNKYISVNQEKSPSKFACDYNNSKRLFDESIKFVNL